MKKTLFYILSFTWGLPMTFVGLITACVLSCMGYKVKRYGYCFHFVVGENWGGVNLGVVFLTDRKEYEHTKKHEHGHALQNCLYGPFMPFLVSIPSALRYWYRELRYKCTQPPTAYDSVWYEAQATKWGTEFLK